MLGLLDLRAAIVATVTQSDPPRAVDDAQLVDVGEHRKRRGGDIWRVRRVS